MRTMLAMPLLALTFPATVVAQAYTPSYELPAGDQLVAIYIGATDCVPCTTPELKAAVSKMKPLLAANAKKAGWSFATVGVALDWHPTAGVALLQPIEEFDEIIVGNNWTNSAAQQFIWADTSATPGLPQVVLVRRKISPGADRVAITGQRVISRFVGAGQIETWVARGAPVALAK